MYYVLNIFISKKSHRTRAALAMGGNIKEGRETTSYYYYYFLLFFHNLKKLKNIYFMRSRCSRVLFNCERGLYIYENEYE